MLSLMVNIERAMQVVVRCMPGKDSLPQVGMVPADSRAVIIQTQSEHQGALAKPLKAKAEAAKPQHRKVARAVFFAVSDTSSGREEDACGDDIRALRGYVEPQAEALTDRLQSPTRSQLSPASSGTEEDFLHQLIGTSMHQRTLFLHLRLWSCAAAKRVCSKVNLHV